MDEDVSELKSLVASMREDLNELLHERDELRDKVVILEDAVGKIGDSVLDLYTKDADPFGETAQAGGTSEFSENDGRPATWSRESLDPNNEHVTVPDTFELQGLDIPRKSIEYAPERANAHQLHEFDDAPSVGSVRVVKFGKWWILVDPDGTTGTRKWMIPLRRETTGGIELKWAQFGQDTGSDSDSDSDSDPDPGFVRRRVLTNVFVSGNTIVFETEWHTVVASEPGAPISIVGSTCEGFD